MALYHVFVYLPWPWGVLSRFRRISFFFFWKGSMGHSFYAVTNQARRLVKHKPCTSRTVAGERGVRFTAPTAANRRRRTPSRCRPRAMATAANHCCPRRRAKLCRGRPNRVPILLNRHDHGSLEIEIAARVCRRWWWTDPEW